MAPEQGPLSFEGARTAFSTILDITTATHQLGFDPRAQALSSHSPGCTEPSHAQQACGAVAVQEEGCFSGLGLTVLGVWVLVLAFRVE